MVRQLKRTQDDRITPQDTGDMLYSKSNFSTSRRRPRSRPETCTRSTHAYARNNLGLAASVPPPAGIESSWRRRQTPNPDCKRGHLCGATWPHGERIWASSPPLGSPNPIHATPRPTNTTQTCSIIILTQPRPHMPAEPTSPSAACTFYRR